MIRAVLTALSTRCAALSRSLSMLVPVVVPVSAMRVMRDRPPSSRAAEYPAGRRMAAAISSSATAVSRSERVTPTPSTRRMTSDASNWLCSSPLSQVWSSSRKPTGRREFDCVLLKPPNAKPNSKVNTTGIKSRNRKMVRSRNSWRMSFEAMSKMCFISIFQA